MDQWTGTLRRFGSASPATNPTRRFSTQNKLAKRDPRFNLRIRHVGEERQEACRKPKSSWKKFRASDRRLVSEPGPCRTPVSSLGLGGFHAAYRKSAVAKYGPVFEHEEQVRLEIGTRSVFGPVRPIQDGMEPVFVSRSELSRKPECRVGPARLQTPRTWSGSVEEAYPPEGIDW